MSPRASPTHNLEIEYPEIAKQWHPTKNGEIKPENIAPKSGKNVWWKCSEGHDWKAIVAQRTRTRSGCPKCWRLNHSNIMKKAMLRKRGSLSEHYPQIASEWHPTKNVDLTPNDVTHGSSQKVWWKCSEGHEWKAIIYTRKNTGCPICTREKQAKKIRKNAIRKRGSFADNHPELLKEWYLTKNIISPHEIPSSIDDKVWWICPEGHEYDATPSNRIKGTGCPYCSSNKVGYGNSLESKRPQLARQWHPTKNVSTPSKIHANSGKKVWWICEKGHEWKAVISSRAH